MRTIAPRRRSAADPAGRFTRPASAPIWKGLALGVLAMGLLLAARAGTAEPPGHGTQFQDWTVYCPDAEAGEPGCHLSQELALRESRQRIMHFQVAYVPNSDEPVAIVTLPLGISLPKGVSIRVDGGAPARFPIERCEVNGCSAAFRLREDLLDQFLNGLDAEVLFYDAERKPYEVPLSLRGFTAGLQALAPE